MTPRQPEPINVHDYEALARSVLDPAVWAYYSGGAGDETSLRENRAAYERFRLLPRALRGISEVELRTSVLGLPVEMPVLVSPMALHGLASEAGECATARAAGSTGTVFTTSIEASRTLEEVAAAATGPIWSQLYHYPDRGVVESLVRRMEAAGFGAIVLTVDSPRWGRHERSERTPSKSLATRGANLDLGYYDPAIWEHAVSWRDVEWLRSVTDLPLILKGILHPQDAALAARHGAAAIIVSNHGGRQLDGAIASLDALPAVADAAGDTVEVYLDGGIRRGTDILRALTLGARAVLVGRPVLWGLAVGGEAGARRVLELLGEELESALALCGLSGVEAARKIGRELLASPELPRRL